MKESFKLVGIVGCVILIIDCRVKLFGYGYEVIGPQFGLGMHRVRGSRARLFSGLVILGLERSRAWLFPQSKIVDTVIHIVAA